MYFSLTLGS